MVMTAFRFLKMCWWKKRPKSSLLLLVFNRSPWLKERNRGLLRRISFQTLQNCLSLIWIIPCGLRGLYYFRKLERAANITPRAGKDVKLFPGALHWLRCHYNRNHINRTTTTIINDTITISVQELDMELSSSYIVYPSYFWNDYKIQNSYLNTRWFAMGW